jgi:hypothetical protein
MELENRAPEIIYPFVIYDSNPIRHKDIRIDPTIGSSQIRAVVDMRGKYVL